MKGLYVSIQQITVVLLSIVGATLAVKCFDCASHAGSTNNDCAKPVSGVTTMKDCSKECYFHYTKSSITGLESETWVRGCNYLGVCTEIHTDIAGVKTDFSCCSDKDGCNTASASVVALPLLIVALLCAAYNQL